MLIKLHNACAYGKFYMNAYIIYIKIYTDWNGGRGGGDGAEQHSRKINDVYYLI